VTAIDIDAAAMELRGNRCRIHGVSVDIRKSSAKTCSNSAQWTAVLYFAALEHMNNEERLQSLAEAWSLLAAGAYSRSSRHPIDSGSSIKHTSRLPFYNWLPHDLAFSYSRFSPRENFKDTYRELNLNP